MNLGKLSFILLIIYWGMLVRFVVYEHRNKIIMSVIATNTGGSKKIVALKHIDRVVDTQLSYVHMIGIDRCRVTTYVFLGLNWHYLDSVWRAGYLPEDSSSYIRIRKTVKPGFVEQTLRWEKEEAKKLLIQNKLSEKYNN